jgi:hypothetical protein
MKTAVAPLIQRIRAEYVEMPGLSLRAEQVQRLCGVSRDVCDSILDALVQSGFLSRRSDGAYRRDRNPDISRARPAKAGLESVGRASAARDRLRAS